MPDSQEALEKARALLQRGRLADAKATCLAARETHQTNPEYWCLRGEITFAEGQFGEAESYFQRALQLSGFPGQPARAGGGQEEFPQPGSIPFALCGLGKIGLRLAAWPQAVRFLELAIENGAQSPEIWLQLSLAWRKMRDLEKSEYCLQQAVALDPGCAEAYVNLGLLQLQTRQVDAAARSFGRASQLKPDSFEIHYRIGHVLHEQRVGDLGLACFQRACELQPGQVESTILLLETLLLLGKRSEARARLESLCEWSGFDAADYHKLGGWAQRHHFPELALRFLQAAWKQDDSSIQTSGALLHASLHCCDWTHYEPLKSRILAAIENRSGQIPPFSPVLLDDCPATQFRCANDWIERNFSPEAIRSVPPATTRRSSTERIRLAYLSSDFYDHATTRLIVELLENHDHQNFEVFGYSYGPSTPSPMRDRVVAAFDAFVDVSQWPTEKIANRIRRDNIDILVDLKGHTDAARFDIMAERPAPIQVEFLGYPGTTGANFIDYVIADSVVAPPEVQPYFSEQIVRLPGCYQPNDSQRALPTLRPSRSECGLTEDGFVFCCFNNSYKITPEVFDAWMQILQAVDGSQLWLLEDNPLAAENLRTSARSHNVSPERLVFAPRRPYQEYLARYLTADLFLDTTPVCAHTTASDSLWMACPLLTIQGKSFASRVSASLLKACSVQELITENLAQYVERAISLAKSSKRTADFRSHLVEARDALPVFNGQTTCRYIEDAYRIMMERSDRSERPTPMDIHSNHSPH